MDEALSRLKSGVNQVRFNAETAECAEKKLLGFLSELCVETSCFFTHSEAFALRRCATARGCQKVTIIPTRAIRGARIPKTWFAFAAF